MKVGQVVCAVLKGDNPILGLVIETPQTAIIWTTLIDLMKQIEFTYLKLIIVCKFQFLHSW